MRAGHVFRSSPAGLPGGFPGCPVIPMLRFPLRALVFCSSLVGLPIAHAAPDGFLDPIFAQAGLQKVAFDQGQAQAIATSIVVLPDARIVLAGLVQQGANAAAIGLARLRADGQVDEGFGRPRYLPAGLESVFVRDAAAQPDGKLVVVGEGDLIGPGRSALVCRFLADGSVDTGFAANGNALAPGCRVLEQDGDSAASAVAIQRDGRIVLAGNILSNGVRHALLVRLDAGGDYDADFGDAGVAILLPASTHDTQLSDVAQMPTGDLVAVGSAQVNGDSAWQVFRLRAADGGLNANFDGDGVKPVDIDQVAGGHDYAYATSVLPDGRIVVGGVAGEGQGYCPAVARLKPDGTFDLSLDGDGVYVDALCSGEDDLVADMVVQSDGRIVLAGDGDHNFFAMRLAPSGGRDAGFGSGGVIYFNFSLLTGTDGIDAAYRIANHGGRLLLAGHTSYLLDDAPRFDFAVARLDNDLIFADAGR